MRAAIDLRCDGWEAKNQLAAWYDVSTWLRVIFRICLMNDKFLSWNEMSDSHYSITIVKYFNHFSPYGIYM
ncbi:hypothetical protein KM043_006971 [Ampulex compressa]|nr:hypothetical protein KM043_006971 [Ampulex compressa]